MDKPKPMLTLSQVMEKLRERGIYKETRMHEDDKVYLQDSEKPYQPEDLTILKNFRFEGDSNPDDNAVLYVLSDNENNKSYMIDSYGAASNYTGPAFDNFLKAIPTHESKEYDFE
ncbi:MAG: hypothetical protein EAS48_08335 [Chryseobacterium sp.]|nr:MAG: hypothetical protein EAS48_08335 [Chryseobacterium sp.]